jgi:hypothetical protein
MNSPFGCSFLRLFLSEAAIGQPLPAPNWAVENSEFNADLARLRKQSPDYDYQREEIAYSAMRRWLETGRLRVHKAITVDPKILQEYVGRYELNARRTFTVRAEGNGLRIDIPKDGQAEMYAESEVRFFLKVADVQIVFVKDAQGRVTEMRVAFEGQKLQAKKVE